MLIPVSRAYRTEYSNDVMTWCGSQMNGYSLALIPSADAAHAQPTCTSRAISQAIRLTGRRSTRAAISPGMTTVAPAAAPAPAPDMSCAIANLPDAILGHGVAEIKREARGAMTDTAPARTTGGTAAGGCPPLTATALPR